MKSTWLSSRALASLLIALFATLLLASCSALIGPRDVEFPLAKLQQSVDRRLPFSKRYLGLFDVTAEQAQLTLPADQNRLMVDTNVTIALPLLGKSWHGKMAISGMLALDNPNNAVVLAGPKLDKLTLEGLDQTYAAQVTQIGDLLARQLLLNVPLYTFKPEDLHLLGVAFVPTKIGTKSNSLVVTFEPVK